MEIWKFSTRAAVSTCCTSLSGYGEIKGGCLRALLGGRREGGLWPKRPASAAGSLGRRDSQGRREIKRVTRGPGKDHESRYGKLLASQVPKRSRRTHGFTKAGCGASSRRAKVLPWPPSAGHLGHLSQFICRELSGKITCTKGEASCSADHAPRAPDIAATSLIHSTNTYPVAAKARVFSSERLVCRKCHPQCWSPLFGVCMCPLGLLELNTTDSGA